MRPVRGLVLVALLCALSACDSELPTPPSGWALADCPSREEPGFVFFGETTIACVRGGTLYEQDLDSLGYYVGSVESHYAYPDLTLALQDFALRTRAYTIDLTTGDVDFASDATAIDSRVVPVSEATFLTVDLLPVPSEPDSSAVLVRWHREGEATDVVRGRIYDGGRRVYLIGADRDPSGDVHVLAISERAGQYAVLRADAGAGTVRQTLVGDQHQLTGLFTDAHSVLYVVESRTGAVFRVTEGALELAWDLGAEPDDSQFRDVNRQPDGEFVVPNRLAEGGVGVYDASFGRVRSVGSGPVRYFAVRPYERRGCGRSFPFFESRGATYEETFSSVDVVSGEAASTSVTLDRDVYDLPQVFCL